MPKVQKSYVRDVFYYGDWAIVALDWWHLDHYELRHTVITRERGKQFQREQVMGIRSGIRLGH